MDRQTNVCPTKMDERKRIAIYGGTFDPVHLGHLEIAKRVSELFVIDQFLFVPARVAPHKVDREVSSGFHRHAMLALATQHNPDLCISTFELDGPARQYTVDTLTHFRAQLEDSADLFFVMGADSWSEIATWREWGRLTTLANLIVVSRPGYEFGDFHPGSAGGTTVIDVRGLEEGQVAALLDPGKKNIFITDAVMLDVSATAVRQAARRNDNRKLDKLVPRAVAEYIRKYRLFRNTNEAKFNS
jgi:nicotinate-nucleotide adenylyltransferase